MKVNLLSVSSAEQTIALYDGYTAVIKFDLIYKRWYYDLYQNGVLRYAGISLTPDTAGLYEISPYSLAVVDRSEDKGFYEPYNELGARLGLLEVRE